MFKRKYLAHRSVLLHETHDEFRIGPLTIIGAKHAFFHKEMPSNRTPLQEDLLQRFRPTSEAWLDEATKISRGVDMPAGITVRELLKRHHFISRIRGMQHPDYEGAFFIKVKILVARLDREHNAHARWKRAFWKLRLRSALWLAAERGAMRRMVEIMQEDLEMFEVDCATVVACQ